MKNIKTKTAKEERPRLFPHEPNCMVEILGGVEARALTGDLTTAQEEREDAYADGIRDGLRNPLVGLN